MAGFEVTLHGRFWVTPEAPSARSILPRSSRSCEWDALCVEVPELSNLRLVRCAGKDQS
jgi:hypothetical protein